MLGKRARAAQHKCSSAWLLSCTVLYLYIEHEFCAHVIDSLSFKAIIFSYCSLPLNETLSFDIENRWTSISNHINLFTRMLRAATLCWWGGLLIGGLSNLQGVWSGVDEGLKGDATAASENLSWQGHSQVFLDNWSSKKHNLETSRTFKNLIKYSWSPETVNDSTNRTVSFATPKLINSRNRIKLHKSADEQKPVHPFAANDYCWLNTDYSPLWFSLQCTPIIWCNGRHRER